MEESFRREVYAALMGQRRRLAHRRRPVCRRGLHVWQLRVSRGLRIGHGYVRMTREARPRYPNSILHNTEDLTSQKIYQAGRDGDELAIEVFRRMGVYLGIGLASLINVLNPEIVVIGGGLSNGWDLFEKHMHQQVIERAFPIPARRVKIVRAECGDDAGLLGAARLAFEEPARASRLY